MAEIVCEADIDCRADAVFDLMIDLRGQDRWLTGSTAFHGTADISSNPVTLGSTYREPGPLGVRNGTVTEFQRPTTLTFHQPMTLRFGLGTVDVVMRYALTSRGARTHVRRSVTIQVPGLIRVAEPLIARAFASESQRTLQALKAYADALPDASQA